VSLWHDFKTKGKRLLSSLLESVPYFPLCSTALIVESAAGKEKKNSNQPVRNNITNIKQGTAAIWGKLCRWQTGCSRRKNSN